MVLEGFIPHPTQLAEEYIAKGLWKGLTIGDLLDRAVSRHPDRIALVDEKNRVTYKELQEKVNRLARSFLSLGIKKDDRVTIQLPNWAEFVYSYLALARIGAIGVMAIPHYRATEMEYIMRLTDSVGYIFPQEYRKFSYIGMIQEIKPRLPQLRYLIVVGPEHFPQSGYVSFEQLLDQEAAREYSQDYLQQNRPDPNDVSVILWTGGTTAAPKGVPQTHNMHICYIEHLSKPIHSPANTSFLSSTPVAHNAALSFGLNATLLYGETLVMMTSTEPEDILKTIERERITTTLLIPTQAISVLNHPNFSRYNLSSLQVILCGAAHVPPELVTEIRTRIGCAVANGYGMTEGLGSMTSLDDPLEVVCHTVGKPPCPGDEYKIVDDQGQELPPGKEGELIARGPCISRGYYKAEEFNRVAFNADGFFFTGDLAMFDQDGHLKITGRKKDMILRGGENISAAEVEELILSCPKVEQVAVVGMPDPVLGEKACAFIKPKGGEIVTLEELVAFLKGKGIASFKLPERIEIITDFPLTSIGKIDKKLLRDWIIKNI